MFAFAGEGTEVAFHLDAVPEGVGLAEEGAEADGHGRSDGTLAEHNLIDGPRRHADRPRHGVLGDAHGFEVFIQKDLAGSDGCFHSCNVWRYGMRSMVIHDGDIGRTGMCPAEHDAPLVVDADGMATRKIAFERLHAVPRRHLEIVQLSGLVHLDEFPHGGTRDRVKAAVSLRPK